MFDLIENNQGDLLLIIESREAPPHQPHVRVRPGHIHFQRSPEDAVPLTPLGRRGSRRLGQVSTLLVVEMAGDDISRLYDATVYRTP